jgi:uncharacterized repeat protein (TIGR03803 family)
VNSAGTVFELIPTTSGRWIEKTIYSFDVVNGANPHAGVVFDATHNLYGTTQLGGTNNFGTVFELSETKSGKWVERVLHSFAGGADGATPLGRLVLDGAGNLYGTTENGGTYGNGTVFRVSPPLAPQGVWTEQVIYSFQQGDDAKYPYSSLTLDRNGNLYGTTGEGGLYDYGTVFEVAPNGDGTWSESVLHSFDGADGESLVAGVVIDAAGNLYGEAIGTPSLQGNVFELMPPSAPGGQWTMQVLWDFSGASDGGYPAGGVLLDDSGNLYGVTQYGGLGNGVAFELTP